MRIVFDHDIASDGVTFMSTHFIDTSDPAVQAMLIATKASVGAQIAAGYNVITKHPAYAGQTRWQAILGEVVRLNDTVARPLLGV